jgi:hypothetical protein
MLPGKDTIYSSGRSMSMAAHSQLSNTPSSPLSNARQPNLPRPMGYDSGDLEVVAWGTHKARDGRSDLVKERLCECSQVELDSALGYIWASWAAGESGIEWDIWPEENAYAISDVIRHCWVESQAHYSAESGRHGHKLERLVARKV